MSAHPQLKIQISTLSQQRLECDELLSALQGIISSGKNKPLQELKANTQQKVHKLKQIGNQSIALVNYISYTCEQLCQQNPNEKHSIENMFRSVHSLREYYEELLQKTHREQQRAFCLIEEKERWELTNHQHQAIDQESSLLSSIRTVRETNQIAREVLNNVEDQGKKLYGAQSIMSTVLNKINFSGRLVHTITQRLKEDKQIIILFSIGLILWIVICKLVFKPLFFNYFHPTSN